jgi:acyl-CoA thioester hydrolase
MTHFFIPIHVRYSEVDRMGRAHHVQFFTWLEMARLELLRSLGISYKEMEDEGLFFVVAETSCRYSKAVEFDDHLKIYPMIVDQSKHVVKFEYEIKSDAQVESLVAKAKTTLVAVDKTGKIADIPEKYQHKLAHAKKD